MVKHFWLFPTVFVLVMVIIFVTAGQGFYRYPCQDPVHFGTTECEPPACLANESCTDFLVKRDMSDGQE